MNKKILIVDDDPIMGSMLEFRLSQFGYEAHYFNSGQKVLDRILQIRPALIISDIIMPGINGYELHRRLRKNKETSSIPFVFLSARADPDDQLEGLRMGADDYICKPVKIEDLVERMESVISRAERAVSFHRHSDFSGDISQMKLNDILQIVEMNYKSGKLRINDAFGSEIGSLFFKNGCPVNARIKELSGEEAFYDLLTIEKGYFEFFGNDGEKLNQELITNNWMSILLNGSRLIDEGGALLEDEETLESIVRIGQKNVPSGIVEKWGKKWLSPVIATIKKSNTIRDIVESSPLSRIRTAAILTDFIQHGIIIPEKREFSGKRIIPEKKPAKKESLPLSEMRNKNDHRNVPIALVTDSASDIPLEIIEELGIHLVPLSIRIGGKTFSDGINIIHEKYYRLFEDCMGEQRIDPPGSNELRTIFGEIIPERNILSIFSSNRITHVAESALQASDAMLSESFSSQKGSGSADQRPEIGIIDSQQISMGVGLPVLEAFEKIRKGESLHMVRDYVEKKIRETRMFFIVRERVPYDPENPRSELEYQGEHTGYRLFHMKNGETEMIGGLSKKYPDAGFLLDLVEAEIPEGPVRAAIMYAKKPDWVTDFKEGIFERFSCETFIESRIGPSTCSVFGLDCLGVAALPVDKS